MICLFSCCFISTWVASFSFWLLYLLLNCNTPLISRCIYLVCDGSTPKNLLATKINTKKNESGWFLMWDQRTNHGPTVLPLNSCCQQIGIKKKLDPWVDNIRAKWEIMYLCWQCECLFYIRGWMITDIFGNVNTAASTQRLAHSWPASPLHFSSLQLLSGFGRGSIKCSLTLTDDRRDHRFNSLPLLHPCVF